MKLLYVCRLYSGFEDSIQKQNWEPKGAPTIAKMLEGLKDDDLHLMLTSKTISKKKYPKSSYISGLNATVQIIQGPGHLPAWLWKFRTKISELFQCFHVYRAYRRKKPDIIYCDRANIFTAAIMARFTNARVIWRVMGVLGIMHEAARHNTLRAKFLKWLWNSPFSYVICTRDGSDGEAWLKCNLRTSVPYSILLNGVDFEISKKKVSLPIGRKALFVGRLEPMKGLDEFLKAVATIQNLQAIIVGDGSLQNEMKQLARELDIENRTYFMGAKSPEELKYIRQKCDFYVSLNTHGNLTNVNLEALSDHLPTIIPRSSTKIDKDTDVLIPKNVFLRFGDVGDTQALINAMKKMMNDKTRLRYKNNMKKTAPRILYSWDARIRKEKNIYQEVRGDDLTIFIADLGAGGAQKVSVSLAIEQANRGKKISLITLSHPQDDFHILPANINRLSLASSSRGQGLLANLRRIRALRQAIKKTGAPQIISFIAPTNILGILACFGRHMRVIISERNDPEHQSFGKSWDLLRVMLYRYADLVTANSLNAIDTLSCYVPKHKLKYVPNPLLPPPANFEKKHEKGILTVGRLHEQKNHKILLEAFAKVHRKHADWVLHLVGNGPLRKNLLKQTKSLGLQNHVTFHGIVDAPYKYYAHAPIFVLPSLYEGTPNALLEAMSCGCAPVITDTCIGARQYIEHKKSGLISPVNDSEALAEAIIKLIEDKELRFIIAKNAKFNVQSLINKSTPDVWSDVLKMGSQH